MADNVDNITIEHLRAIRSDLTEFRGEMRAEFGQVRKEFDEIKKRFRILEHHVTGLRRDEAVAAGEITDLRHQIDDLLARLQKIESSAHQ